jgi:hypothetical protein
VNEEWKDISGYEGIYQIGNNGNVRSYKDPSVNRKLKTDAYGYAVVVLSKNGKYETKKVHRLVGLAFIENENNLLEINHMDENKKNNVAGNLEWCDHKYNMNYGTGNERRVKNRDYALSSIKKQKGVVQFAIDGTKLHEWACAKTPATILNATSKSILACCRGKSKTSFGYRWEFAIPKGV